jgi:hypothetical protein
MVSYKSKMLTLAGEFASTDDSVFSTVPGNVKPDTKGQVISGYGVLKVPNSEVAFIARVDLFNPNTSVTGLKQTRFIGGISYQLNPHVRLLADVDALSYETTPSPANYANGTQLLVQSLISF